MALLTTYNPEISVVLFKNIDRQQGVAQRYAKASRTIDLTPYLGDQACIDTSKDIYAPDGKWRISFGDQPDPKTQESLYALIEPMDVIEIRGSRVAYKYAGKKLPLLMRGLVGSVRRAETMGTDTPQRGVIVSGQDFGKLWLIHGVWMEVALAQESPLLSIYQLQVAIGMEPVPMNIGTFMEKMTSAILNPKIQAMSAKFAPPFHNIPIFTCQSSVTDGQVVPQAVGAFQAGPFWNLVKNFSDSPWNELFISDSDETGPVLVFRPTPFKDVAGNGAFLGGSKDPGTIKLDHIDVVAIEVGRSDEHCANFFWTPPGASMLDTPGSVTAWNLAQGTPFDFKHPNNEPTLYGYRKMEWPTQLLPVLPAYPRTQPAGDQDRAVTDITAWHVKRAQLMRDMNHDNVVLEDGVIRARGREDFMPGKYLQVTRAKVVSEFYLTRVSHSIRPLSGWEATLFVERGDGFLVRNKMQTSPYWAGKVPYKSDSGLKKMSEK
jgi:hypothetical protein